MNGFQSVVILTALALEHDAVIEQIDVRETKEHPRGTRYSVGALRANPAMDVAVAEIGVGNDTSAVHAERAAAYFSPDLIAFSGVAGGIRDVELGDVVIASKVYGYESGKAGVKFRPRPPAFVGPAHRVEQQVRSLIRDGWKRSPGEQTPAATLAPIAAGEAVIASSGSDLYERITEHFSDAVAVEMEGRGVSAASLANDALPTLIVRGISDLIDGKTPSADLEWQPRAARNAARFLGELLARLAGQPSPLEQGDNDVLATATRRAGDSYYINVPRLLSDRTAFSTLNTWGPDALRGIKTWAELDFQERLRLLELCAGALSAWHAPAMTLEHALAEDEVGARVAFEGHFRTRNWRAFNPTTGLTGNLEKDPHAYTDIGARRIFVPLEPAWATSTTAGVIFNSGSVRLSCVGLLRQLNERQALVSPYLLGPPATELDLSALWVGR